MKGVVITKHLALVGNCHLLNYIAIYDALSSQQHWGSIELQVVGQDELWIGTPNQFLHTNAFVCLELKLDVALSTIR